MKYGLVFITAPSVSKARSIVQSLLHQKLIACANVIPAIESHFLWKNKKQKIREALIIAKLPARLFKKLKTQVVKIHPYEVPEVVFVAIHSGHAPYLAWLEKSCS
jgi:periplasmic divalent cation tolerance protein